MVAMSVLFTSVFSGIQIIWDKQFGFLKNICGAGIPARDHVRPDRRGRNHGGHPGIILMVFAVFIGLRITGPLHFLVALGFMVLVGIAFTAFGIAVASRMEDMAGSS